ncbi:MAG: thiamine biosynthesis protein ThiJ [Anaerolineales bacterium]|nr:thiamine biosynthesis protein ThiJ [Anaerolineae bacterium]PWB51461.1 MAG: thiamine biosynthesis protein ThiJ [Anaerolineales bacterium]
MPDADLVKENHASFVAQILMPLPDHDFDPTEAAIPWMECTARGWNVAISTELGNIPQADQNKLKGPLPGLISASATAREAYRQMSQDAAFLHPIPYAEITPTQFDALLLPGGDGLRVRQYLESKILQGKVLQFYLQDKMIGAICHGVLVLARTLDPETGHSILFAHKVTAVPKLLDRMGFNVDRWFIKHGYIMYSSCVEDEVRATLQNPADFSTGNLLSPYVVCDGNLVTSRTYMDAEVFARRFANALQKKMQQPSSG